MDFHSLLRRDLQFLCKKNRIPANITNVAMADALKALDTVEGLEEFLNQTKSTAPQSPTSVAKELPTTGRTASRTTRRKTTQDETQISQSVTRPCRSLAGEMDQENKNMNVLQSPAVPPSRRRAATSVAHKSEINDGETENDVKLEVNMPKTPGAQSTRRKAPAAASSRSKAPETKKDESVQRAYSTRRSVRLLEKCMGELCLKPKDVDEPAKDNDAEKETAAQEKDPAGSAFQGTSDDNSESTVQTGVIPGRDLGATLEKEWDMRDVSPKDDNGGIEPDWEIVDSETQVDLDDISVSNDKSEACEEKMNELDICPGSDSEEAKAEEKESEAIHAFDSFVQVEDKEILRAKALTPSEKMIQDDDCEVSGHAASAASPVARKDILDSEFEKGSAVPEKFKGEDDDETMVDETNDDALKEDTPMNEDATLSINTDKDTGSEWEESTTDSDDAESESESEQTEAETDTEVDPEEENSGVDSNQAAVRSRVAVNDTSLTVDKVEEVESDSSSSEASESDESETESDSEEDPEEDSISDADSNLAVFGSDVAVCDADEELEDCELAEYENSNNKTESDKKKTPTSPLPMSADKGITPVSPFAAESISGQFPRPNLSTTPAKSSSKKTQKSAVQLTLNVDGDSKNKENTESYSGRKAEEMPKKKKKKNAFDEANLKDMSRRQLTKMLKELTLGNNRTALQTLPDNQIAERN